MAMAEARIGDVCGWLTFAAHGFPSGLRGRSA